MACQPLSGNELSATRLFYALRWAHGRVTRTLFSYFLIMKIIKNCEKTRFLEKCSVGHAMIGTSSQARQNMPDRITRRLFKGASTVQMTPGAPPLPFPIANVPHLVGAIDGSVITVIHDPDNEAYVFEVVHPWLDRPMIRLLNWNVANPAWSLVTNAQFFLAREKQRKGYGARSIAVEVRCAQQLGIAEVACPAGRAPGQIGYATWPKLGFDRELSQQELAALTPQYVGCTLVSDVLRRPGGAEYWEQNGGGGWCIFDTAPGSTSWDILGEYMQRHGIEL